MRMKPRVFTLSEFQPDYFFSQQELMRLPEDYFCKDGCVKIRKTSACMGTHKKMHRRILKALQLITTMAPSCGQYDCIHPRHLSCSQSNYLNPLERPFEFMKKGYPLFYSLIIPRHVET